MCLQSKNTSSMDIELEFFKGQRENPIYAQPLNKTKESPKRNSVQRICMYVCTPPSTTRWVPQALYDESHLKPPLQGQPGPCRLQDRPVFQMPAAAPGTG